MIRGVKALLHIGVALPNSIIERSQTAIAAAEPKLKVNFMMGDDRLQIPANELDAFVHSDFDKWRKIIKEAGIALE